ncbi:hypothetical protein [Plastoroseomonas hellenica]|uniref:hypothetical protein n=1 Tax=Plastoroseomonas hellenica TaxID=2687306 RepID=UPI001BAD5A53|nr:hypothetical protein [Plastoroseomonas hellenica]MBR0643153.1 hypothetical protein [Plastoroseomonas hellenica]
MPRLAILAVLAALLSISAAAPATEPPRLSILSPAEGAEVVLAPGPEGSVAVRVSVPGFLLRAAGACGGAPNCGHLHLKADFEGDSCNAPGRPYNSRNSDTGGDTILAHLGHCPVPTGRHSIGILLANDDHSTVLVDGRPVIATVTVVARRAP